MSRCVAHTAVAVVVCWYGLYRLSDLNVCSTSRFFAVFFLVCCLSSCAQANPDNVGGVVWGFGGETEVEREGRRILVCVFVVPVIF